jgi:hypothetical protein
MMDQFSDFFAEVLDTFLLKENFMQQFFLFEIGASF